MPRNLYYIPLEKKKANGCTVRVQKQAFREASPGQSFAEPHRRESRDQEAGGSGLVGLVGGRPAGLQHLLHQVEADARLALVLSDGEVIEQVEVAHVGAVRVAVLVHQPLPLGGVGVARADVLGLQVLQLAVDGVAVRHCEAGWRTERGMAGGADGPGRCGGAGAVWTGRGGAEGPGRCGGTWAVREAGAVRRGRGGVERKGPSGPAESQHRDLFRRAQQRFPPLFLPQCPTGARLEGPAGSCSRINKY